MNASEQRVLRLHTNEEFLRALSAEDRQALYRKTRQLDEMTAHWQWVDEIEADLEVALAAAAEGVFNWPQREPGGFPPRYDLYADSATLKFAAQDTQWGPARLHVVTRADLELAQDRLMRELAEYYDTHDAVTGRRFDKETQA